MDWTPRFGFCGDEIIPVDLNSHLYAFENMLFEAALDFEPEKAPFFGEAAQNRKRLMDEYLKGKDGLYYDYNFVTGKRSEMNCSAQFMPFFAGLLNDKNAFNRLIDGLILRLQRNCRYFRQGKRHRCRRCIYRRRDKNSP